MISIDLGTIEYFDSETQQFEYEDGGIVRFEYTLRTVYDWEEKWRIPFLKGEYTQEQIMDFYIRMALDPVKEKFISTAVMEILANYIKDPNTATTFTSLPGDSGPTIKKPKIYTAEEIYALMFSSGISIEFENRNLNRLLTILRIIGNYNNPPKKMSKQDILKQNASLNAQRKAALKTKG